MISANNQSKIDNRVKFLSIFISILLIATLGPTITGNFAKIVSYEDICISDHDCGPGKVCCIIDKSLGVCNYEQDCQSMEFLCQTNDDCEEGAVCCISEGMIHGICNHKDMCMSIDFFVDFASRVQRPAPLEPMIKALIGIAMVLFLLLICLLIVLMQRKSHRKIKKRHNKRKKKKK